MIDYLTFSFFAILFSCKEESFEVIPEPILPPQITGITPNLSDVGTRVNISGTNFSLVRANNKVFFSENASALIVAATDSTLTVEVPEGAVTGAIKLSLANFSVEGPQFMVVPAPIIDSIRPQVANFGDTISIYGNNFSDQSVDNIITLNENEITTVESSTTLLKIVVPEDALSDNISINVFGQITESETLTFAPKITQLSADSVRQGEEVTISGINFDDDISKNEVLIGGEIATITNVTSTEITALVPFTATQAGLITVNVNDFSVNSTMTFKPILVGTTVITQINVAEDDVEESISLADSTEGRRMSLLSNDLEIAEIDAAGTPDIGLVKLGFRFNNVQVPQGVNILSANVQLVADNSGSNPAEVTIYGENTGNAAPYTEEAGNLTSRDVTTANVVWNIPEWLSAGDITPSQLTNDIESIVQEIVNRDDWVIGNSINIIMVPSGDSANQTSASGGREAESYDDDNPDEGARLSIRYE